MLQKILVVIVGLVMSVVGALSPDGLLAGKNEGAAKLGADTAEETLATLRLSDGQAFARVSVLWLEVDGRRVTEDAWGTGEVEEMRFKVGVKGIEGMALGVGEKVVDLHPTDVITIRMFRGDFSYRGIGTPSATVQLQGTVKTTLLKQGEVPNRVLTQVGEIDVAKGARPAEDERVAYVVLTTGQRVDTVAVEDGGKRLFTEEAAVASEASQTPGNLLAKWVKIDGKLVREYTWGDGMLGKIEFEPAESVSRSVVLAFNGEVSEIAAGERVLVEDFVGEYLAYQVSGGLVRLRLDGYAATYKLGSLLPVPQQGGEGAPLAAFDFTPISPRTTDSVLFRDASTDDGDIVFRLWDFGDNTSGIQREVSHRFTKPGTYEVRLTVTDNDLKSSNATRTIIVRNAEPVADFDYSPRSVNTDTLVGFSDHSHDSDGSLVNWTWDFGDGEKNYTRHPAHRFKRGGDHTVTLTVTDDLGAKSSLSKVIAVRNNPPLPSFTYSPSISYTLDPITFMDTSSDTDGRVVAWNWSFGDGRFGSGSTPVHAYRKPGVYDVKLVVTDDAGDTASTKTSVVVLNRAPFAEFDWTPKAEPASVPITFTSMATDPDGEVMLARWNWGDGSAPTTGFTVAHTFPRAGTFDVTLTVTDNTANSSSVTRSVTVANSAPRPNMGISQNPTFRASEVVFTDLSTDPDGDAIVSSSWDFGDGSALVHGRLVRHQYSAVGTYSVTLFVKDAQGQTATLTREVHVLNRAPTVSLFMTPQRPAAGEPVLFTASGSDPDLPGGPVEFEWQFSDGFTWTGPNVTRTYAERSEQNVKVRSRDSEGTYSAPLTRTFMVEYARPNVSFTWSPLVPRPNQLVNFTDASSSANGAIREWVWRFGDGTTSGTNGRPNISHTYRENGPYVVNLTVTDVMGQSASAERIVLVNTAPTAAFTYPTGQLQLRTPIPFTDTSSDVDGYIVNWSWTFSDGFTSADRHPTHPGFPSPGTYDVTLVVTDDKGTTGTASRPVNVMNTAPIARWTHDTLGQPLAINRPVHFNGYDNSYDPDGTPLISYTWSFGDGTPATAGANVSHTFTRSGKYVVGLTVADGLRSSERTADSHKQLRILPDHPITVRVRGVLPDGALAAINAPPYSVSARVGTTQVDGSAFVPVGSGYEITLDPSIWVAGEILTVRINAPFLVGVNEQQVVLRDTHQLIDLQFQLRMWVRPTIAPLPGEETSALAPLLGEYRSYGNDPLYHNMTELPKGTGRLAYADGSPAEGMPVVIEARWVPLRHALLVRNALDDPETTSALSGWCRAGGATTAGDGVFNWSFDDQSACVPNGGVEVFPAGRWEVRARPQVPTAENRLSDARTFYVDPTGGRLIHMSLGLA